MTIKQKSRIKTQWTVYTELWNFKLKAGVGNEFTHESDHDDSAILFQQLEYL